MSQFGKVSRIGRGGRAEGGEAGGRRRIGSCDGERGDKNRGVSRWGEANGVGCEPRGAAPVRFLTCKFKEMSESGRGDRAGPWEGRGTKAGLGGPDDGETIRIEVSFLACVLRRSGVRAEMPR